CHSQSEARVKLAEVDGFAGVSLRLVPILADLENHPCIELRFALAENFGDAEQQARSQFDAYVLPGLERPERGVHGRLNVFASGLLMQAYDFAGPRRVPGLEFFGRADAAAADHQIVL